MDTSIRLTSLAHGGGCGCKLAPSILQQLLSTMPVARTFPDVMVGIETGDDAAVYRLNDRQALIATTDFFTPVVDDPADFGRIAATNALSDVYAMGGRPILALAILGMPVATLPIETVQAIVAAGAGVCHEAGIPVAGGHSIDSPEPIYGLVALGLADPDRLLRNVGARPGDRLILTKALGIGILSAALTHGTLEPDLYQAMVESATTLNVLGADMPVIEGVHAMTDVTGFGLLGHALEMTRPDGLSLRIALGDLPLLLGVVGLISSGVRTGASGRNWSSFGREVTLSAELPAWASDLLCDPQTSGGLLIAAAPDAVPLVLEKAAARGIAAAAVIGTFEAGSGILVA